MYIHLIFFSLIANYSYLAIDMVHDCHHVTDTWLSPRDHGIIFTRSIISRVNWARYCKYSCKSFLLFSFKPYFVPYLCNIFVRFFEKKYFRIFFVLLQAFAVEVIIDVYKSRVFYKNGFSADFGVILKFVFLWMDGEIVKSEIKNGSNL